MGYFWDILEIFLVWFFLHFDIRSLWAGGKTDRSMGKTRKWGQSPSKNPGLLSFHTNYFWGGSIFEMIFKNILSNIIFYRLFLMFLIISCWGLASNVWNEIYPTPVSLSRKMIDYYMGKSLEISNYFLCAFYVNISRRGINLFVVHIFS